MNNPSSASPLQPSRPSHDVAAPSATGKRRHGTATAVSSPRLPRPYNMLAISSPSPGKRPLAASPVSVSASPASSQAKTTTTMVVPSTPPPRKVPRTDHGVSFSSPCERGSGGMGRNRNGLSTPTTTVPTPRMSVSPSHRHHLAGGSPRFGVRHAGGSPASSLAAGHRRPPSAADRFIPSRTGMNLGLCRSALFTNDEDADDGSDVRRGNDDDDDGNNGNAGRRNRPKPRRGVASSSRWPTESFTQRQYNRCMLSTLLNVPLDSLDENARPRRMLSLSSPSSSPSLNGGVPSNAGFVGSGTAATGDGSGNYGATNPADGQDILRVVRPEALGGRMEAVERIRRYVEKRQGEIPTYPLRVIDAPNFVPDYYLNLMSWNGNKDLLAIALSYDIYLYTVSTKTVQKLGRTGTYVGENGKVYDDGHVTAVVWISGGGATGDRVAVGRNDGLTEIWDAETMKVVRVKEGAGKIMILAWNSVFQLLTAGGAGPQIVQEDVRSRHPHVALYRGHTGHVCGLKWSAGGTVLASGGNDDRVCIWDITASERKGRNGRVGHARLDQGVPSHLPRLEFWGHTAAVKGMDWCPFAGRLLASGGGTRDKTIKVWDTDTGKITGCAHTGSQICSVVWSKHRKELCSAHGFNKNELAVWKYIPGGLDDSISEAAWQSRSDDHDDRSLVKIKELYGHTGRILGLESSPGGEMLASVSEDQTIRFWNVFGVFPRRSSIPSLHRRHDMRDLTFGTPPIR